MKNKKADSLNYQEEFSVDIQKYLINYILSDTETLALCRSIIKADYFEERLRSTVTFILEYADTHRETPKIDLVRAKTRANVELVDIETIEHRKWVLGHIVKFCRFKALESAIMDGADLLLQGEGAEVERRVKEAMQISLTTDLGSNYFQNPLERLTRMRDHSSLVPTGWKALDQKLYGGFSKGTLNIFCGGSGAGKSLFLQNLALNWAFAGLDVIYVTLELDEDLIQVRLDSMVTGKGTKEVFKNIEDVALQVSMKGKKSGSLIVKKFPQGGTTANDLRAYLKEYIIKTGKKPDAVVVDYLDLLYPNNQKVDPSNLFSKDKYVSEELRSLMGEFDVLSATASQLNRQSIEAQGEFDHSHIAGGISKINTADNVLAIFTSTSMKEKGLYTLMFLKTRTSGAVGQKIDLAYDPTCMRITDMEWFEDPDMPLSKEEMKKSFEKQKEPSLLSEDAPEKESPKVLDLMGRLKARKKNQDD